MIRRGLLCRLTNGEQFLVDRDRFVIGRLSESDLCLPRDTIARRHARISRHSNGSWSIMDLESSSGIRFRGELIRGVLPLAVGMRIDLGPVWFEVLDLEYESAELTAGIHRTLSLTCAPLLCRAELTVSTVTSSRVLDDALSAALLATNATVNRNDQLAFVEPIELAMALLTLDVFATRKPGGVDVRLQQAELWIGRAALELLADHRAAPDFWAWLTREHTIRAPLAMVRGLVHGTGEPLASVPAELECEPSSGLQIWLRTDREGYLIDLDGPTTLGPSRADIVVEGSPAHVTLTPGGTGSWVALIEPAWRGSSVQAVTQALTSGAIVPLYPYYLVVTSTAVR